jgi:hypothetical protein
MEMDIVYMTLTDSKNDINWFGNITKKQARYAYGADYY